MHSSFFNYSLTRPYPYRWFTPVTIIGAVILLVLLSVMNFVQNSYSLIVEYTNDPNSTIANGVWYSNWPSYLTSSVRPTCQPANLPVNTQFFTNQSGLVWTLTSIFQAENDPTALPSLPYLNNILDSCSIRQIQMEFDGTLDRSVAVSQTTPWDVQARAFVTCRIWSPMGHTYINLTAMYDPVQPYAVAGSSAFVARDGSKRASMYWSEALLSAFWVQIANKMDAISFTIQPKLTKGVALLEPSPSQLNISTLSFFNLDFNFLQGSATSGYIEHGVRKPIELYIQDKNNTLDAEPQIWSEVDNFAKSMYSAALTDLGQVSAPSQSNMAVNATVLQLFSSNFSTIHALSLLYYDQLEIQDYSSEQQKANATGPLGLTPSVISTSYLCQVPRRKPMGDIFIAVLLADLVLLQAAWKLYTLAIDQLLLRRRPDLKCCQRCATKEEVESDISICDRFLPHERLKAGGFVSKITLLRRE